MSEDKKDKAGGGDIFVKKIKKGAHGAHGGVWKLAYADFVTAMMAFFLLMWLLNVTSEEMKSGLAQYFSPDAMSTSSSGSVVAKAGPVRARFRSSKSTVQHSSSRPRRCSQSASTTAA